VAKPLFIEDHLENLENTMKVRDFNIGIILSIPSRFNYGQRFVNV
jgi:hypothetical protein